MFSFAYRNLLRRKARTGLGVLGIVIGIAAFVSIVSASYGVQAELERHNRTASRYNGNG